MARRAAGNQEGNLLVVLLRASAVFALLYGRGGRTGNTQRQPEIAPSVIHRTPHQTPGGLQMWNQSVLCLTLCSSSSACGLTK
jgi:hypothetical protein